MDSDTEIRCIAGSGLRCSAGAFIAHRYDPDVGFRPEEGESYLVRMHLPPGGDEDADTEVKAVRATEAWLTGLWRSRDGALFATESRGHVYVAPAGTGTDSKRTPWKKTKLEGSLWGVWGLSEKAVFVWGPGTLYRWNGRSWKEFAAPDFAIESLHGHSEELLLACGEGGRIARWEGGRWTTLQAPVDERLVSVHVAGPQEYYVAGNMGTLLEFKTRGWARIGRIPMALQGDVQEVAVWKGELWIAASRLGLWKRNGKSRKLVQVKEKVLAVSLDVRQDLVVAHFDGLCSSDDGRRFFSFGDGYISEMMAGRPLGSPPP